MMIVNELLQKYKDGKISTSELSQKLQEMKKQAMSKKPLSEGQKGIWLLEKLAPGNSAYHLPICFWIRKQLDIKLFQQALLHVLEQHPILKSVIIEEDGVPFRIVQQNQPLAFKLHNIAELDREEILPFVQRAAHEPFSLQEGPLIRTDIYQRADNEYLVLINVHHIISDGSSLVTLVQGLLDSYLALLKGHSLANVPLSAQYDEFVEWEQEILASEKGEAQRNYWKQQLSGELPLLELATDYPRHQANAFQGAVHRKIVHQELLEQLRALSKSLRISMTALFLSLFNVLLYQYSNQRELIVGMASMGRPNERFDNSIGYFINMIPIRSHFNAEMSFAELAKQIQLTMLEGIDHGDYPFPLIVKELNLKRSLTISPIFQVGFFYQNFISGSQLRQLEANHREFAFELVTEIGQQGEYELALEVSENDHSLHLNMKYNPQLFESATIERMTEQLVRLAEEAIYKAEGKLGDYRLLSPQEEQLIIKNWNKTEIPYAKDKCVYELFEEQARKTPESIAVVFENEKLTYRELDERSTALAIYLQQQGVRPGSLIGISVERSLNLLIGLLGIMKSGGAYVPLDPNYPIERLSYMIQDSKISIVISQSSLKDKLNKLLENGAMFVSLDSDWHSIEQSAVSAKKLQRYDDTGRLAYVMYTSGSTGNPKGVMIRHFSLTNFLQSMEQEPGIKAGDSLLAVTTFCFDISGLELYLPLICGATCYICETNKIKNVEQLLREIQVVRPTLMQATPATWMALFLYGWRNEEKVKILCGGEALPVRLKQYFAETESEAWNLFGPTETTIWSTIKQIRHNERITIGKPIANTQIYILNEKMQPVPIGVPGELYIGGDGIAQGYLNRAELTAERFIANPFQQGTKMYRTGDSARWLANGEIEYLGRIDGQVKLNGYRIETGEIEARLNMYPTIRESAVVIHNHQGHAQLRAFYVRHEHARHNKLDIKDLRLYMKKWLPAHMIPAVYTELDEIPLTPNGKVNKLELAKRTDHLSKSETVSSMSARETETKIIAIWKEVIGTEEIDPNDGFFEAGGDSFTAVTAAARISKEFSCEVTVTNLFEHSNVKELCSFIMELKTNEKELDDEKHTAEELTEQLAASMNEIKHDNERKQLPSYIQDSVAIIGISCHFPDANGYRQFWENLREGKESVRLLSDEELASLNISGKLMQNPAYVPIQSTIEGKEWFDPEFFNLSPKDAERMDPQMRLLLMHSWKAVEDAGYCVKEVQNTAVFMSSSNNYYQSSEQSETVQIMDNPDDYVAWLLSQSGTIPTMISYQLGLKGPSFSVHSNCSSSLAGLYAAYQAICNGDSDYALVGAATLHSATSAGYVHMPGLNFSSDGHLKAFDETADGMVGGEGVAVIMLKRASQAIADGDHIYALLRGIKVNNDGGDKVGFYAPSVKGQADVIERVLKATKIDPHSISYIEAHGTGTKLGDPIEIAALSQIYQKYTSERQFCGIGSVKTNIGHLDTAAGLAGCIKLSLSLYHNQIPASLNYKKGNREINFQETPFYVVDQLQTLEAKAVPHRAALSSFGIGGTNGHAIFEQYIDRRRSLRKDNSAGGRSLLIPLSARNEQRLIAYADELLQYMNSEFAHPWLEDIAYTLQVGREAMSSRVVFIVKDSAELISKLTAYVNGEPSNGRWHENKQGMSESLNYWLMQDEDLNELIDRWIAKDRKEKLAELWVRGYQLDWKLLYTHLPFRVSLPTYPFAKEKYWKAKVNKPEASTIINDVKPSYAQLHPLIDRNISDFTSQQYVTMLRGNEFYVADHVINGKKVLPGVAYVEMSRAAGELAAGRKVRKIKQIVWSSPIVVEREREVTIQLRPLEQEAAFQVYTNDFGQRMIHAQGKLEFYTAEELSEEREVQQIFDIAGCLARCEGVISHSEFYEAEGASTVYQYGAAFRPIQTLHFNSSEALSQIVLPQGQEAAFDKFVLHPSLLEGCLQTVVGLMQGRDIAPFMPFAIDEIELIRPFPKQCFVHAVRSLDLASDRSPTSKFNMTLIDNEGRTVAFIRNYSIRAINAATETMTREMGDVITDSIADRTSVNTATLYYYSDWVKDEWKQQVTAINEPLLLFTNDVQARERYASNSVITIVKYGQRFENCGNNTYVIHPGKKEDYLRLLDELKQQGLEPLNIVHQWSCDCLNEHIEESMQHGIYSLFYLTQALAESAPRQPVKLLHFYYEDKSVAAALSGALSGFMKTVRLEHPKYVYKVIGIQSEEIRPEHIAATEFINDDEVEVLYRNKARYVKRLKETEAPQQAGSNMPFRNDGVYLITGGMGGIGYVLALHLSSSIQSKIVLIGRSDLDEGKRAALAELEKLGSEVMYIKADISVREEAMYALEQVRSRFGKLHGILHCAGILNDKLLVNKTYDEVKSVLAAKVNGTIWLDEATRDEELDFFVLFSSISQLGNVGQADYAYANSFLNSFADYREAMRVQGLRSGKILSINWPYWKEGELRNAVK